MSGEPLLNGGGGGGGGVVSSSSTDTSASVASISISNSNSHNNIPFIRSNSTGAAAVASDIASGGIELKQSAVSAGAGGGAAAAASPFGGGLKPLSASISSKRLRVLFMHGLGSNPYGTKYKLLSSAVPHQFEAVCVPDMRDALGPLRPKRVKYVLLWLALAALATGDALWMWRLIVSSDGGARAYPGWLMAGALLLVSVLAGWFGFRWLMRSIVRKCIAIQQRAIKEFKPDIVVGVSWGGGIATFCMLNGAWHARPALLLCPAGSRLQRYAELSDFPSPLSVQGVFRPNPRVNLSPTIHVVHATRDSTIPFDDTEYVFGGQLAHAGNVTVEPITTDRSHSLRHWCTASGLVERVLTVYRKHQLRLDAMRYDQQIDAERAAAAASVGNSAGSVKSQ